VSARAKRPAVPRTHRKRSGEPDRSDGARYRTIVELQSDLVTRFLPDGTLTFVNAAVCRATGMKRADLIGKCFFDFLDRKARADISRKMRAVTRIRPGFIDTHPSTMPTGATRWFRWSNRAVFDARGRAVEFQSVGHDVTDLQHTQQALRESEERYRAVVELAPSPISIVRDGRFVFMNRAGIHMLRYRKESEIIGKTLIELIAPEDRAMIAGRVGLWKQGRPNPPAEIRLLAKDGTKPVVVSVSTPIRLAGQDAGMTIEMQSRYGFLARLRIGTDMRVDKAGVCILLFEAARELLLNAFKHAGVRNARVRLARPRPDCIELTVADRGRGFDADRLRRSRATGNRFGLFSIRERVALMGGCLSARSSPGRGSTITVSVPVATRGGRGRR
jgi:PAS domain S-box-containing protein